MPIIATPLSVRSRPSAASPAATCWTYGQWLQMKVTTSAGPVSWSRLTVAPVAGSGSVNGGAEVPSASMVDSVAMHARVGPQRVGRADRRVDEAGEQVQDRDLAVLAERRVRLAPLGAF